MGRFTTSLWEVTTTLPRNKCPLPIKKIFLKLIICRKLNFPLRPPQMHLEAFFIMPNVPIPTHPVLELFSKLYEVTFSLFLKTHSRRLSFLTFLSFASQFLGCFTSCSKSSQQFVLYIYITYKDDTTLNASFW